MRGSHILAQLWTGSRHGLTCDRYRHELTGRGLEATGCLGCLSLWLARGECRRVGGGALGDHWLRWFSVEEERGGR